MTAPDAVAPPAPAPVLKNTLIVKNLTSEQIRRILDGDNSFIEVGDILCLRVTFSLCSAVRRAELAAEALADAPAEVKAAGRAEILAMLSAAGATAVSRAALTRIIGRLNLPDDVVKYDETHIQQARELVVKALANCAICVIDSTEFFDKFVAGVYETIDARGRLTYRVVIRVGNEEFQVVLKHSDFGRGKKKKVPDSLNNLLRAKFGVEIDQKSAADLLGLLERSAVPEQLHEEIALKSALRQLLKLTFCRTS